MRLEPPDPCESEREGVVLRRALGHEPSPHFAGIDADDGGTDALANRLRSFGWTEVAANAVGKLHILLGDDGHLDALVALAQVRRPDVVAVRQRDTNTLREWPGWDNDVIALGYAPCQFSGSWRLYVSSMRADELGPRLSSPAMPEELVTSADNTRAELVNEVVRWRTAALSRWAEGAATSHERNNPAAKHEADHLRTILAATHATLSWRITRPLRAVQSRRLRGARR